MSLLKWAALAVAMAAIAAPTAAQAAPAEGYQWVNNGVSGGSVTTDSVSLLRVHSHATHGIQRVALVVRCRGVYKGHGALRSRQVRNPTSLGDIKFFVQPLVRYKLANGKWSTYRRWTPSSCDIELHATAPADAAITVTLFVTP